jgi:radical SAM superfamily enzyme YgiQ (UPF0313 family)
MRGRYLFPLVCFLGITLICTVILIPRGIGPIAGFAMFLCGYASAYLAGVSHTLKNSYAVVKLKNHTPYVMPWVSFLLPTLIFTAIFIPKQAGLILQFGFCLLCAALTYALGLWQVVRDLRLEAARKMELAPSRSAARKRLVLINPVNPARTGLTVNTSSRFPPLGLGIVAALTPADYAVMLVDENIAPFVYQPADLVGLTAFTAAAGRAYELAAVYRAQGVPVVMGGIHASMCPEEASGFVDSVVAGEAENVWAQVLADFEAGRLQKTYRSEPAELAQAVAPRRDLFSPQYAFAPVQTSRGCPMDCYFCSVTPFNGRRYRQRPVAAVLEELAQIEQAFIFFVDDNLLGYGAGAEARAIELFRGMVERKLNKSWFCQASLNFGTNDEVLYWAARSGCKMVFIGLESANPEELELMHKNLNLRLEYAQAFRRIHRHGIAVLGAFIFGSDTETAASMERKTAYILTEAVDVIQTTILTPLPGTRLFEQYRREQRLKYPISPEAWQHYDMTELTYRLRQMPEDEFQRVLAACSRRLYSDVTLAGKFLRTWWDTRSLETACWAYASNKNYQRVGRPQRVVG